MGFWQQSYTYLHENLNKVMIIDCNISKDLSNYFVTIRSIDAMKLNEKWKIKKSPSEIGDGLRTYKYNLFKNKGQEKNDLMMDGIKRYLKDVYDISDNYNSHANCEEMTKEYGKIL